MKTMKLWALLAVFTLSIPMAQAQWGWKKVKGNGNIVTKTVNTGTYDDIKVVGSMDVTLVAGSEGNISVTTDENLHEYMNIEVKGNTLEIKHKKNYNLRTKKGIKVTVPFKDISGVRLVGSGDVNTKDQIKSNDLDVSVTGSGDIVLDVQTTNLDASVTGSGDLTLRGSTDTLTIDVTGSGDFRGTDLQAKNTDVTVSGSGDAKVVARESIKARVSGSGDILYTGNPAKSDTKAHGSGDIRSN